MFSTALFNPKPLFFAPADHQIFSFPADGGTCSNADVDVYVDSHDPSTSENTYRNSNLVYPHRSTNKCNPLLPVPNPQPPPRKPDSNPLQLPHKLSIPALHTRRLHHLECCVARRNPGNRIRPKCPSTEMASAVDTG